MTLELRQRLALSFCPRRSLQPRKTLVCQTFELGQMDDRSVDIVLPVVNEPLLSVRFEVS
jgi:hypothetical protein